MKKNIHPQCLKIYATCTCGNSFEIISTLKKSIHLDVCSKCHPFYTGTQRILNTRGRVNKFHTRFNKIISTK
ncbi:50S ribosomal subunit protein L31 [Wigglesworthia glossinidia endosymbiont of Glossina morsitans morsitans (Yale colony)]|uniref:Large ribosomal subunit protein bL31 n=1 Tax=Wigglesworthia glossinidia endosymbiont of Glossina morsitans morsitans (Yale colony) TaxID=1142511 RepID=H6Q538_WIGGL|nr:50S ribosomal protein L31 [Wigglesworthia glossinidia]AFA41321.1 50S ribosomal subunit protein L31 [Wigglesworthia glossinidia endosymbiont of Glossina morsitans morsitans (Yale colony)]